MARQLTEQDIQLNATAIANSNTTVSIARPGLSIDDGIGFVGFEPNLQTQRIQTQSEIKVSGKYPEVNYVTFNIPNLNSVEPIFGNVFTGVTKVEFPRETLTPTDTSTSGTSGTSGTAGTNSYPPFGEIGVVGEIREFLPTGQLYIWTFNYNIGRWIPYEAFQGGGAAPTSGGVSATGLGGNDGGSLGGGGNNDPSGGPGGGRPGGL